ncbi:YdjM family protein [Natronomonas pharaonis DSM 2160]|uniref:YdjM family protein n=1 Tax=Natronomonas pharaonis (strain ATCC 35678 / DSM 2160 / CIP 103997 / JCM 8858 / NBRC 14720 / NCIMB 2260 / Gabara) TaxID=348780 RepID=A0A1U7EYY3_NATPD|nr:metal-dependent hydrolase [Natronomonas pharaonis]CAI50487.1 YdjM family protein [Natronomonas pharaonis DSM 2160]
MPSTVVHAAVAFLLAVGLLGRFYDRRALLVVLLVILFPELDTALGWVMDGAHRTVLHTMMLSVTAAAVLYWETVRDGSWLRDRFGDYGIRVAWVALVAHTVAHIALDWSHLSGINFFWPLRDTFYALDGELYLSASDGVVQTFVDIEFGDETGAAVDAGRTGTTADTHVGNPAQPSSALEDGPVDRRFPIAVGGWQLYLVCLGAFALVARRLQTPRYDDE